MKGVGKPTPFVFLDRFAGVLQVNTVTGIILAGGKSRRMGEDKRFITLGTATLLDRCRSVMTEHFEEVLIITAQDSPPLDGHGCRVYEDLVADCGSLGGLYTGLHHASCSRIFVVACDMPFLNSQLIKFFVSRDPDADVVIGRLPNGLQPMHAVYAKQALPWFERRAQARQLKIQDIVLEPSLKIAIAEASDWAGIDPTSRSFQNVNTPADLAAARVDLTHAPFSS
jgi:molybdenum cofactor guanylyltransferase